MRSKRIIDIKPGDTAYLRDAGPRGTYADGTWYRARQTIHSLPRLSKTMAGYVTFTSEAGESMYPACMPEKMLPMRQRLAGASEFVDWCESPTEPRTYDIHIGDLLPTLIPVLPYETTGLVIQPWELRSVVVSKRVSPGRQNWTRITVVDCLRDDSLEIVDPLGMNLTFAFDMPMGADVLSTLATIDVRGKLAGARFNHADGARITSERGYSTFPYVYKATEIPLFLVHKTSRGRYPREIPRFYVSSEAGLFMQAPGKFDTELWDRITFTGNHYYERHPYDPFFLPEDAPFSARLAPLRTPPTTTKEDGNVAEF